LAESVAGIEAVEGPQRGARVEELPAENQVQPVIEQVFGLEIEGKGAKTQVIVQLLVGVGEEADV
jgi:hypothetical protein